MTHGYRHLKASNKSDWDSSKLKKTNNSFEINVYVQKKKNADAQFQWNT